jgi:hypothetical protein
MDIDHELVTSITERRDKIIREATELAHNELNCISIKFSELLKDKDVRQRLISSPFNLVVKIPITHKNIFDQDDLGEIALSVLSDTLKSKFNNIKTDKQDWIITIGHSRITQIKRDCIIPVIQTVEPDRSAQVERIREILTEKDDMKKELEKLRFENELVRQENEERIKNIQLQHQYELNQIRTSVREDHRANKEARLELLELHSKSLEQLETTFTEEKKFNTMEINKLLEKVQKLEKGTSRVIPPKPITPLPPPPTPIGVVAPPVGRVKVAVPRLSKPVEGGK